MTPQFDNWRTYISNSEIINKEELSKEQIKELEAYLNNFKNLKTGMLNDR